MAITSWRKSLVVGVLGVLLAFATTAPVDDDPSPPNPPRNDENAANFPNQIENNSPAIVNSQDLEELLTLDKSWKQHNSNSQQIKLPRSEIINEYDYEIPNGYLPDISERQLIAMLEYASGSPDAALYADLLRRIQSNAITETGNAGDEAAALAPPPPPELTHSSENQNLAQGRKSKDAIQVTNDGEKEQINVLTSLEAGIGAGNPDCKYPGCLEQFALPPLEDYVSRDPEWFRGEERGFEKEYNMNEDFKVQGNKYEEDERDGKDVSSDELFQVHPQFPPNQIGGYKNKQVFQGDKSSDRVVPYLESQRAYPPSPPFLSSPPFLPSPPSPPSLDIIFINGDKFTKGDSGLIPVISGSFANSLNSRAPKPLVQSHYVPIIESPSRSPSISEFAPPPPPNQTARRRNRNRPDATWFQAPSEQHPVFEVSNNLRKSNAARAKANPPIPFETIPGLPIDGMDDRNDEIYEARHATIIKTGSGSSKGQSFDFYQGDLMLPFPRPPLHFSEDDE
ncbi:unnamed protein product [Orchesella dallaii]|uniref:Uncharacterized protein n=1 Tax=Orchesella dallaii TaxID=48710 RepID=A0ABP1S2W8_9HEXA